jgi:hypothetical protein
MHYSLSEGSSYICYMVCDITVYYIVSGIWHCSCSDTSTFNIIPARKPLGSWVKPTRKPYAWLWGLVNCIKNHRIEKPNPKTV